MISVDFLFNFMTLTSNSIIRVPLQNIRLPDGKTINDVSTNSLLYAIDNNFDFQGRTWQLQNLPEKQELSDCIDYRIRHYLIYIEDFIPEEYIYNPDSTLEGARELCRNSDGYQSIANLPNVVQDSIEIRSTGTRSEPRRIVDDSFCDESHSGYRLNANGECYTLDFDVQRLPGPDSRCRLRYDTLHQLPAIFDNDDFNDAEIEVDGLLNHLFFALRNGTWEKVEKADSDYGFLYNDSLCRKTSGLPSEQLPPTYKADLVDDKSVVFMGSIYEDDQLSTFDRSNFSDLAIRISNVMATVNNGVLYNPFIKVEISDYLHIFDADL